MRNGMLIAKLAVVGPEKKAATLTLHPGLNVIIGPSNVGKSYVYDLIDYMLTSSDPPKDVPEAEGYTTAQMEAIGVTGDLFSFHRDLATGNITMFPGSLENAVNQAGTPLNQHFQGKRKNTASEFLLGQMGIPAAKLRSTMYNQTQALSVRIMSWAAMVKETRIINEWPPLVSEQYDQAILSRSLFEFLLSGRDGSSLKAIPTLDKQTAAWGAKTTLYDQLIAEIEEGIKEKRERITVDLSELENFDERLRNLRERIGTQEQSIERIFSAKSELVDQVEETELRRHGLTQLIGRFQLLEKQYESDLERLKFIAEGEYLFGQLNEVMCPLCNRPVAAHDLRQACTGKDEEIAHITQAAQREAEKITRHLIDLKSTIEALSREREEKEEFLSYLSGKLSELDRELQSDLQPSFELWSNRLDELIQQREMVLTMESERKRLDIFKAAREELGSKPKKSDIPNPRFAGDISIEQAQFAGCIKEVLEGWNIKVRGNITFDNDLDMIVNGKARKVQGKGIRALFHSAYSIGLLRYCIRNKKPHPGFVVLDSPIHSLQVATSKQSEIPADIKDRFYRYLSHPVADEQIIILENDDVPDDLRGKLNRVDFYGNAAEGREGFFPEP